jgi:lipopolysaccharide export system permease protein
MSEKNDRLKEILEKIRKFLGLKKLYLFIVSSYIGPLILTFFIAVFILLMQFLWKYIDDMVGKGFEWYIIAELLFYASATFVPMALPLAILLASIMVFGNMGENYELVAMKSSGISFRKAMMPLVIFTMIICGAAFYFSNNILPIANLKFGTLLFDVREKKPALNISEGIFYNDIEGFVIRVGSKESDGKTINNVMIFDHTAEMGNINVTVAKKGFMEKSADNRYLIFTLFNGYNYYERVEKRINVDNRPMQRTRFKEEVVRYDISGLGMQRSNEELFKDSYQMQNITQLDEAVDSLSIELEVRRINFHKFLSHMLFFYSSLDTTKYNNSDTNCLLKSNFLANFSKHKKMKITDIALANARGTFQQLQFNENDFRVKREYINKHNIEWHRKFELSFACLVLFFIGAPLGAIIRRGGLGLPVVFATLFFIVFHVISMTGEKFAKEGVIPAYEGMWISSLIFLPIGILLTYSASTDAPLLDMEIWKSIFRRLIFWRKNTKKKRNAHPSTQ